MHYRRVIQRLVAALAALGTAKTEVLQARLGVSQPLQSDKRRG
jgi:hypothetical protein